MHMRGTNKSDLLDEVHKILAANNRPLIYTVSSLSTTIGNQTNRYIKLEYVSSRNDLRANPFRWKDLELSKIGWVGSESKPGKFVTAKPGGRGSRGAIFVGSFVAPRPSRLLE